jgi:hypothetical protein
MTVLANVVYGKKALVMAYFKIQCQQQSSGSQSEEPIIWP